MSLRRSFLITQMSKIKEDGSELKRIFFSASEVAEMFGVSTKSVYRLIDRDLLKSSSALRHKRISQESIEQFIRITVNNGGAK